jgi:hypothetical protein
VPDGLSAPGLLACADSTTSGDPVSEARSPGTPVRLAASPVDGSVLPLADARRVEMEVNVLDVLDLLDSV